MANNIPIADTERRAEMFPVLGEAYIARIARRYARGRPPFHVGTVQPRSLSRMEVVSVAQRPPGSIAWQRRSSLTLDLQRRRPARIPPRSAARRARIAAWSCAHAQSLRSRFLAREQYHRLARATVLSRSSTPSSLCVHRHRFLPRILCD